MTQEKKQAWYKQFHSYHGFNEHNGIDLIDVDDDFAVVQVELTKAGMNPLDMAHGGLIFSLCDVACGVAARTCGRMTVTLDASVSFLRPGKDTRYLTAVGKVIKPGKTTAVCECDVTNDDGKLLAKCISTAFYLKEQ